ncbi:MAG: gamma-glutamyl-gamma-aminobutyrate hydrolase family protein [Pseudobdellovibrionaceae bacterium]
MFIKIRVLISFLFLVFVPLLSDAQVELIVWQTNPGAPQIILPQMNAETPEQAVERYRNAIMSEPDLAKLLPQQVANLNTGSVKKLEKTTTTKVRLNFIANTFSDMTPTGERILNNQKYFGLAGADPYVVALAGDIGLSASDSADFVEKLASKSFVDLGVSLGGADIDPELYNEKPDRESGVLEEKISKIRDAFELKLVKAYKKSGVLFFGICRGHQMGAIADGHKLYQDITISGIGDSNEHGNVTESTSQARQTWHHLTMFSSLLERFSQRLGLPEVNSIHHQSVRIIQDGASFVVAEFEKVVEALQGKPGPDGYSRSLSTQFHIEFPKEISGNKEFSERGFEIIKGVVSYARFLRIQDKKNEKLKGSCRRVYAY